MYPPMVQQMVEDEKRRKQEELQRLIQAISSGQAIRQDLPPLSRSPAAGAQIQQQPPQQLPQQPQPTRVPTDSDYATFNQQYQSAPTSLAPSPIPAPPVPPMQPQSAQGWSTPAPMNPLPEAPPSSPYGSDFMTRARAVLAALGGAGGFRPNIDTVGFGMGTSQYLPLSAMKMPVGIPSGVPPANPLDVPQPARVPTDIDYATFDQAYPERPTSLPPGAAGHQPGLIRAASPPPPSDPNAWVREPWQTTPGLPLSQPAGGSESMDDSSKLMKALGHWLNWAGQQKYASPTFQGVHEFGGAPGLGNALISAGEEGSDILSPAERAAAESMLPAGVRIPQNMKRSDYAKSPLPQILSKSQDDKQFRERMDFAYNREDRLAREAENRARQAAERLEMQQRSQEKLTKWRADRMDLERTRLDRADESKLLQVERMQQIPAADVREIVHTARSLKNWKYLRDNFEKVMGSEYVGLIKGRLTVLQRKVGWDNPEVNNYLNQHQNAIGQYLTAMTGAQRGMQEVAWLQMALPRLIDSPETFRAALQGTIEGHERDLGSILEVHSRTGKDVQSLSGMFGISLPRMEAGEQSSLGRTTSQIRERFGGGTAAEVRQRGSVVQPAEEAPQAGGIQLLTVTWPDSRGTKSYDVSGLSEEEIAERIEKIKAQKGKVSRE